MEKEEVEGDKSPVKSSSAATSAPRGFWDREVFSAGRARAEAAGYQRWGGRAETRHAQCMPQPRSPSAGSRAQPRCHLPAGFLLPVGPGSFSDG